MLWVFAASFRPACTLRYAGSDWSTWTENFLQMDNWATNIHVRWERWQQGIGESGEKHKTGTNRQIGDRANWWKKLAY